MIGEISKGKLGGKYFLTGSQATSHIFFSFIRQGYLLVSGKKLNSASIVNSTV
jgi:hypothetical protein